jgi:hypothetical protein
LSSLKTLKTIEEDKDENIPPPVVENDSSQSQSPKVPGEDEEQVENPQNDAEAVKVKRLQAQKELRASRICPQLRRGRCKDVSKCQCKHPGECNRYAKFGSGKINPKGCKRENCQFFHPILCRDHLTGSCKRQKCSTHHLTGITPKEEVKPTNVPAKVQIQVEDAGPSPVHHHNQWGHFLGQDGLKNQQSIEDNIVQRVTQTLLAAFNLQRAPAPMYQPPPQGRGHPYSH